MDLHSGLPYWIAKNPLYNYFNPLEKDYSTDVAIIGSGITGALVAHELCKIGLKCLVVDKRTIATGSSIASTALLQYEIDVPLYKMSKMLDEDIAVLAFKSCLQAITDVENVFKGIGFDPEFDRVPSVFYASNKQGLSLIKKEYEIRKKHKLPVNFLNSEKLKDKFKFEALGALVNDDSAQLDTYLGATSLLQYNMEHNGLKIFTHTEIDKCEQCDDRVELLTKDKHKISCKYVVIAAGFEAGKFLPKDVMQLTSTYALASQPVQEKYLWPNRALIWETKEPYLYIRTTRDNRIIVGGEDVDINDPIKRDSLLRKKVSILEKKFQKLFPKIPFSTDMVWCGTFSSTSDGLPYIGTCKKHDKIYFALGYGGNGITFSMNAAQMISNRLQGIEDSRFSVFGFERYHS